ncbi:MAG: SEC-C domain-containing protein [Pseudomonadota bacterium]
MKTGRNESCWCGSKIKYKKCHLDRDQQKPVDQNEIHKKLSSFNQQQCCSVPSELKDKCTSKIIKAHSVSKSSSLKEIAIDGHVLTTFKVTHSFNKTHRLEPKLIGINKASTFNGFCSYHDKTLFSSIEDLPFLRTEEQCFLVAYRAVSRELFAKRSASNVLGLLKELDKGKSLKQQIEHQNASNYYINNHDLTTNDLVFVKSKLDRMLVLGDYSDLVHVIFELENPASVMTSAILSSEIDFEGGILQNPSSNPNEIPDYLIINSFAGNGKGYIVMSWLAEHSICNEILLDQLLKKDHISNYLTMFVFASIENNYLCPTWWASLSSEMQDYICKVYSYGVSEHTDVDVLQNVPDIKMPKVTNIVAINRPKIARN